MSMVSGHAAEGSGRVNGWSYGVAGSTAFQASPERPAHAPLLHPDMGAPHADVGSYPGPSGTPGLATVALPRIEAQPWVKNFVSFLSKHTTGIARVDLRRPTPPSLDHYTEGNLLFANTGGGRRRWPRHGRPAAAGAAAGFVADGPAGAAAASDIFGDGSGSTTGARIKITRNCLFFQDPTGKQKPWVDLGLGMSVEMDSQKLQPVARIKIKDLFSIKALPCGIIKFSKSLQLGSTGLSAKILYELPLHSISSFWRPPARLMVRLDNTSGSGLHLTPTGIEFDEKLLTFSSHLAVRAAVGFTFPRSLPIDRENDEFGFKVHRLSLKSKW